MKYSEFSIIRDTREKNGWFFDEEEKKPGKYRVVGTVVDTLDAGDYSIKGYEKLVRIERKNGFCELFGNFSPKDNNERFIREMEKLKDIPHKYILIESQLTDDILGLSIPQMRFGPPSSAILKWLTEISIEYNVMPMFVGSCGKMVARYIFEHIAKKYNIC